ncbi:hypothetical protein COK00_18715 [Bacillus cereus]|uniref:hypothetical protein n=1 Tax=Bacillus cereus TaxID=1396 RepID=UPI000BF3D632|nr:hypothetical protein [Bacillus cereus]PFB12453.1 hypothetical protein CN399_21685 [Bacillus cereus]PFP62648.1 hypothetical protein COK00_18715 [Bacillus cereus]PFV55190.1 hypothetical protein COL09_22050 [Bacillus cereus]PGK48939.1 hypothetical protein CN909_04125 [Bacillus cereus]
MKKKENNFANFERLKKECFLKECFHQDENCSDRIIKAHSIQNNKILNKISENGEVLMIDDGNDNSIFFKTSMQRKGRKIATTFTGFCGVHDKNLFAPIEDKDYQIGNKEQEFLFAYRALAKEYHTKMTTGDMTRKMKQYTKAGEYHKLSNTFDENNKPDIEQIKLIAEYITGTLIGHDESEARLQIFRERMNKAVDNTNFSEIVTDVIELDEEYHIAVSSIAYIERDLNDKVVNELKDLNAQLAPLFVTIFPQGGKTYILLSYFERNKRKYKFIREQILTQSIKMQKVIISNLIVAYFENWTVSPIRWNKLSKKMQSKIHKYYAKTISAGNDERSLLHDKNMNVFL